MGSQPVASAPPAEERVKVLILSSSQELAPSASFSSLETLVREMRAGQEQMEARLTRLEAVVERVVASHAGGSEGVGTGPGSRGDNDAELSSKSIPQQPELERMYLEVKTFQENVTGKLEHAKSLMDTAVALVERKVSEKANAQDLKDCFTGLALQIEKLEQVNLDEANRRAKLRSPEDNEKLVSELITRSQQQAKKLNTIETNMSDFVNALEARDGAFENVKAMEEEVRELRVGFRGDLTAVQRDAAAKPSTEALNAALADLESKLQGRLQQLQQGPAAPQSPAGAGVAPLGADERYAGQMDALQATVDGAVDSIRTVTEQNGERLQTFHESLQSMQEAVQEALARKASKAMLQDELGRLQRAMTEHTERQARQKADARELQRLQRDVQDLAHIQMLNHKAAVSGTALMPGSENPMGLKYVPVAQSGGQTSPRVAASLPAPDSQPRSRPSSKEVSKSDPNVSSTVAGILPKPHPAMLVQTGPHHVFVPTAVKPPSTFYMSHRNLLLEAEMRNMALARDLPPVTGPGMKSGGRYG